MEQCTIIIPLLYQFHEIVTVDGCLVIQANHDVAQHGLYLYLHIFVILSAKVRKNREIMRKFPDYHYLCN